MKNLTLLAIILTFFATAAYAGAGKDSQEVFRAGTQKSFKGPNNLFTVDVQVDMVFPSNETAHYSGAYVTFQPGARTAWHLHPAGQHMVVTKGVGLTGTRDGNIITFKTGDAIWCPPDIDHWHGATPDSPMTHLVLTGVLDGENVIWKEKVTDEQYFGKRDLKENDMEKLHALSQRQQGIIPIAAFTASGDMDRLKPALTKGLESGLTVNEIKEVLVHLYAYTGFPRSLNALSAFMKVMDDRKEKGIEDVQGEEASPVPSDFDKDAYGAKVRAKLAGRETDISNAKWQLFSPAVDRFLKEHLFADLFVRDVISHKDRELATISALANMTGTEGQLRFHLGAAMNTGLSEAQMKDFISVLRTKVGDAEAESAQKILTEVLNNRK